MWPMRFPFVSRERYDEQRVELERTRAELAAERDRTQHLWNFLNWRTAGGVAFDTSMLPEPYQPKAAAPTSDATAAADKVIRAARAPGQVRRDLSKFELEAEQDFARGRRPISKEQVSLVSELNKAADEGQKAAG
jgi:hypothetical protein